VPPIRLAGDFPSLFTAARFQPVTRLLYRNLGRCSSRSLPVFAKDTARPSRARATDLKL
jgi:hypothetical protein